MPPVAGAGVAFANASASESPVGYVIASVLGLLVVPLVRWLMKREDRRLQREEERQAFEQQQTRRRDRILAHQALKLGDLGREQKRTNELLEDLVERLREMPEAIVKKCNGG